jgi:hypothetical protein
MRKIERLGPSLSSFDELLALDAPDYPIGDPEPEQVHPASVSETAGADEEEEIGRGLRVELLFVRVGRKRTLWLGSANATMRAWTGRNAEVTTELHVTEALEKGLKALLDSARIVKVPDAEYQPDAAALEEEALERARAQVAARWTGTLSIDDIRRHPLRAKALTICRTQRIMHARFVRAGGDRRNNWHPHGALLNLARRLRPCRALSIQAAFIGLVPY